MTSKKTDILIIGAGLSGLTAAHVLKSAGRQVKIIEASDAPGGRVRTDYFNGFLLDRGFQVLLNDYPEAKHFLNYNSLDLQSFNPGSIILNQEGIYQIGDPLRDISTLMKTLKAPVGTLFDKLNLLKLRLKLAGSSLEEIFSNTELSTLNYLKREGFGEQIINNFFNPFLSGIFLEKNLDTSSRMFEFVFKMFSQKNTSIPAKGMEMIAKQLAAKLNTEDLILNETVLSIDVNSVLLRSSDRYHAESIIIATSADNMPEPIIARNRAKKSVTCLYFSADNAPYQQKLIALNANSERLVNNIAVMSNVSKHYAPEGKALISVSLIGDYSSSKDSELINKVIAELKFWYPDCIKWEHLRTYHIPYALPNNNSVTNDLSPEAIRLNKTTFICGDHLLNGSINAAMKSGRIAAEAVLAS